MVAVVRVRVLDCIVLVAVYIAIVCVVIVVVIVVGVVMLVSVLDAVGMRMDVQMRWLGCVVATRHENLGTARPVTWVQFSEGALGPRRSVRSTLAQCVRGTDQNRGNNPTHPSAEAVSETSPSRRMAPWARSDKAIAVSVWRMRSVVTQRHGLQRLPDAAAGPSSGATHCCPSTAR